MTLIYLFKTQYLNNYQSIKYITAIPNVRRLVVNHVSVAYI